MTSDIISEAIFEISDLDYICWHVSLASKWFCKMIKMNRETKQHPVPLQLLSQQEGNFSSRFVCRKLFIMWYIDPYSVQCIRHIKKVSFALQVWTHVAIVCIHNLYLHQFTQNVSGWQKLLYHPSLVFIIHWLVGKPERSKRLKHFFHRKGCSECRCVYRCFIGQFITWLAIHWVINRHLTCQIDLVCNCAV